MQHDRADEPMNDAEAMVPVDPDRASDRREDVARRAYDIYCERGCVDGHDVEDWTRAEEELRGGGVNRDSGR
jgi:hypothetical protein